MLQFLWDHDGRIRVRRYAGERCLSECVIERHSGLTSGVMVGLRFCIMDDPICYELRYRTVACFVMGSSPVPLKTHRVGQRCTLNLSRAETSSCWCGVVVRRGRCQLRCRPRHLTMVQNYVVRRQKPSCS
ncbi:uncharacterized protein TNCV_2863261 [Trichonephila clavipes]|nr:uncharacterized protein TNCV_2863261 [Trichonephila clavipes]